MMKTDTKTTVEIIHTHDSDADPREYLFQDPNYVKEDQARLDSWLKDEWHFIGIRVRVTREHESSGSRQTYTSPGLWAIESDSAEDYKVSVAQEELDGLMQDYPELKGCKLTDTTPITYEG